jgi:hypothetical protein
MSGLLDLVENKDNGTILSEKIKIQKKSILGYSLSLTLCQSVRECPKILGF